MAIFIGEILAGKENRSPGECKELALTLTKIKRLRHTADYHLHRALDEKQAIEAITVAKGFISRFNG